MYLSFYNLKHKPFQISTDPDFLWLGEKHEEALATLKYGIEDNKGFLLLTGDVGTGKTTLINSLLKTAGDDTLVATIRDPDLEPMDFYHYAAHAFGLENNFSTKGIFLILFEQFLHAAYIAQKKVLLIIDEAQRINQEVLEEVRLLSNIEKADTKLLNIFFVGQIEFNEILLRPENKPIRQRITVNYNIPTLSRTETEKYILHRLKVAGSDNPIFNHEAIDEIFRFSQGYPRLINIICDRALLTGFVEESDTITRKHVKECARELTIPRPVQHSQTAQEEPEEINQDERSHPQQGTRENHSVQKVNNQENKYTVSAATLTVCIVILMGIGIFSFSPGNFIKYNNHSLRELIQNFLKPQEEPVPQNQNIKSTSASSHPESIQKKQKEKITPLPPSKENNKQGEPLAIPEINDLPGQKGTINAIPDPTTKSVETEHKIVENSTDQPPKITHETEKFEVVNTEDVVSVTDDLPFPEKQNEIIQKQPPEDKKMLGDKQIEVQPLFTFTKMVVPFPSNSNLPPVDSLNQLNMLVESLMKRPSYKLIVTGFTDSQGNESFNEKLSEFRANTIKSYLVARGMEESRIICQGLGSQRPIATNSTLEGRTTNRRVEIEIVQKN